MSGVMPEEKRRSSLPFIPLATSRPAAGSYDESFRVWDVRSLSQPLQTGAVACGGGIWRVCWHPSQVAVALCACMQNGFAVVKGTEVWPGVGAGPALSSEDWA